MGVPLLQSFLVRYVPNSIFPINILNEIKEWKRYHTDCLIVFDVMGFAALLSQISSIDNLCGGNYHLLRVQMNLFLKTLCDHGATLIFFYDGPTQIQKCATMNERYINRFKNNQRLFDDILAKKNISTIIKNHNHLIHKKEYTRLALNVCKLYGKFHISCDYECDLEIAKYATENNAMAILAHDSDFLIFEGDWRYWSISESTLLSNFRTNEFSRLALRKHLGLSQNQMPLLATLAGNDIIKGDSIYPVFMHDKDKAKKFYSIASFISTNISRLSNNKLVIHENGIKLIAHKIFADTNIESQNLIKKSIESYDIDSVSIKYFEESTLQQISYGYTFMYIFLYNDSLMLQNDFYDFRQNNFILMKDILSPIYRRLMGVILKHKNKPCLKRTILYCNRIGNLVSETFQPEYPSINLPELDTLIIPTESDYTHFSVTKRFELLSWLITGEIEELSGLNRIDKKYMIVNATLYYLVKQKQVSVNEADCILAMVYAINENEIHHQELELVNPRAIMIIELYVNVFLFINYCFITLGLTKWLADIEIDGIYFHYLMNMFTNKPNVFENFISRMRRIRHFYQLCD